MIRCEFFDNGVCRFASAIVGTDVATHPTACTHCLKSDKPKSLNEATASLIAVAAPEKLPDLLPHLRSVTRTHAGPGTELKRLLHRFFQPDEVCDCDKRAAQMDRWGVDGCREHLDTIAGWLMEEAQRRGLSLGPISWIAARSLIHLAIRRAQRRAHKEVSYELS